MPPFTYSNQSGISRLLNTDNVGKAKKLSLIRSTLVISGSRIYACILQYLILNSCARRVSRPNEEDRDDAGKVSRIYEQEYKEAGSCS